MTERLYYHDSFLWSFSAQVVHTSDDGLEVELDRTAFYPTSGGQPHDLGTIAGIPVIDVIDHEDRIVHKLATPLSASSVDCEIDTRRRLDHMRQHTGQHVLSAVMEEQFGLKTVSFHLGAGYSTVDVEPMPASLEGIEAMANERLLENLPVTISFEHSSSAAGLRKPPDRDGMIRVITIAGLDRSACGGTHVRYTGEVGSIVLGKTEKVRKALRIEFYCADRAIAFLRRKASDAEAQLGAAKERLAEADKLNRRMSIELAEIAGTKMLQEIAPDAAGRKIWKHELPEIRDDAKAMLNAFLSEAATLGLFIGTSNGTLLFGSHESTGVDCGQRLKQVISELGGKGGGTARLAQGSISDAAKIPLAVEKLLAQ